MAFAVVCKSCQARFLLNDGLLQRKAAGRVVVRCRQCRATIEVEAPTETTATPAELAASTETTTTPVKVPATPAKPAPMAVKPAPAPPRPVAKGTLMGIGAPAKPNAAAELVALSPGLLNIGVPSPQPAVLGERGFPEPPAPPSAIEELDAGDWEVQESRPNADAAPESLDDFVEELPPSLPPGAEDPPSSTGTPSLQALAHHDERHQPRLPDDFFANLSVGMNEGASSTAGAPTIDVSSFANAAEPAPAALNFQTPPVEATRTGKQTLPLFELTGAADPNRLTAPAPRRTAPTPDEGSLNPAALDHSPLTPSESVRARRNVVAPPTRAEQPAPAASHRSGLAGPVLLVLGAAAAFLIWKRGGVERPTARVERAVAVVQAPSEAVNGTPREAATPTPTPSAAPEPLADDVTFETTPTKPALAVGPTTHDKPSEAETTGKPTATEAKATDPKPSEAKPSEAKPSEAKPELAAPSAKEPPQVAPPSGEPAGPFDREAAAAALTAGAAQASTCRKEGDPSGVANVIITFAPSGRVTSANIGGPPFAGTPTGGCIAAALRKARVPPFEGERVTVSKTIVVQ